MKRQQLGFGLTVIYVWALATLFGALAFETLIIYPNIFHDVPRSLGTAIEFATVSGPSDFFPALGAFAVVTGSASVVMGWRQKGVRVPLLASVIALLVLDFAVSAGYLWERNTIMFTEGPSVHSAAFLQETAQEFLVTHRLRVAG